MKKISIFICAIMLLSVHAHAQTTIAAARAAFATGGIQATVAGRVTNGNSLGPIRYFQDGTGGIAAYFAAGAPMPADSIRPGDSILVSGTIVSYNNLLEINPITSVSVVQRGGVAAIPVPRTYTAANAAQAFNEANEGILVSITGLTSLTSSAGGTVTNFASNANYLLNGTTGLVARINTASSDIVGRPAPSGNYDIIGIMSQFSSSSATSGYQLLPRYYSDFVQGGAPNFTSNPTATSISTTALTISFTTDNAGTSKAYYGLSATALTDSVINPTEVTAHTVDITGLQAGTIYYVKFITSNSTGSNTSRIFPFVTESSSTGSIKAYFVSSVDTTLAYAGNAAKQLLRANDDTLIAYINRARESVDIAIYNWNNSASSNISSISGAVNDAKARGVNVRVIADGGTGNISLASLTSNIPIQRSPQSSEYTIMHNKFVVIDAKSSNPNSPIVWTGSTNWTNDQMNYDYNNVIIIQDQSLAKVYTMEFEEMWGSESLVPGAIFNGTTGTARFGLRKLDNTPHNLKIGGKLVQSYFSPSDGTNSKIIETINTANSQIQTANLILTRTDVANAIRNKVNTLTSRCSAAIVNDTNAAGPAYLIIKSAVGDSAIRINPVRSNIFHHKYLIVDSDSPFSDPTVLTGSHNWSTAGDTKNDENTLIIHDLNIANQFYQEFGARMREFRMQAPCTYVTSIEPSKKSIPALNIYPNPAQNYFVIDVEKPTNVQVINSLGQSILCITANQKTAINTTTLPTGIYSVIADGYKPTSLVINK